MLSFANAVEVDAVGVLFAAEVAHADVIVVVLLARWRQLDADGAFASFIAARCSFAIQQIITGFVALYPSAIDESRLPIRDALQSNLAFAFVEDQAEHADYGVGPGKDFPAEVEVGKDACRVCKDGDDREHERGYGACKIPGAFTDAAAAQPFHAAGDDFKLDRATHGRLALGNVDVIGVTDGANVDVVVVGHTCLAGF